MEREISDHKTTWTKYASLSHPHISRIKLKNSNFVQTFLSIPKNEPGYAGWLSSWWRRSSKISEASQARWAFCHSYTWVAGPWCFIRGKALGCVQWEESCMGYSSTKFYRSLWFCPPDMQLFSAAHLSFFPLPHLFCQETCCLLYCLEVQLFCCSLHLCSHLFFSFWIRAPLQTTLWSTSIIPFLCKAFLTHHM